MGYVECGTMQWGGIQSRAFDQGKLTEKYSKPFICLSADGSVNIYLNGIVNAYLNSCTNVNLNSRIYVYSSTRKKRSSDLFILRINVYDTSF